MILRASNPNVVITPEVAHMVVRTDGKSLVEESLRAQAERDHARQELENRIFKSPGGPEAIARFHKIRTTMKRIQK